MNISNFLQIGEEAAQNTKEGDYIGEDGLWHCGTCKKPLQKRIHSRLFDKVVWCICDCQAEQIKERMRKEEYEEEMKRIRRLRDASMMENKYQSARFSDYMVREGNEKAFNIAKRYVQDFKKMYRDNIGLVFYGAVGTGKSYTAACIANNLLANKIPVVMTSFVRMLQDFRSVEDEGQYIRTLNSSRLLIFDDFGAERDTDYVIEKVYNAIDSRVRTNKPMIITTNLSFEDMMKNPDIRYRRIYDRIFENCHPVELSGPSFRIVKAVHRQERMKEYFPDT